ncbi:hypothetical protein ACJX0J_011381 [Zea mays]
MYDFTMYILFIPVPVKLSVNIVLVISPWCMVSMMSQSLMVKNLKYIVIFLLMSRFAMLICCGRSWVDGVSLYFSFGKNKQNNNFTNKEYFFANLCYDEWFYNRSKKHNAN